MKEKEAEGLLALASGEDTPERRVIDTFTLPEFLFRFGPERDYNDFDDYFYLPVLTPLLQSVYKTEHEVFILGEEERQKLLADDAPTTDKLFLRFINESRRHDRQRQAEKKAPGERFSVISFDYEKRSWTVANPVKGAYTQVKIGPDFYAGIRGRPEYPVVEVHTHPDNALFSPVDYTSMLSSLANGQRFYRGGIVLCPDVQILALATRQTPLYSYEEAVSLTKRWTDEIYTTQDRSLKKLKETYHAISQYGTGYMNTLAEEIAPQLAELEAMQERFKLSEDEVKKAVIAIIYQNRPTIDHDDAWHGRILSRARRKLNDESSRLNNELLIKLARDLNVRLYISDNLTDFVAFSA